MVATRGLTSNHASPVAADASSEFAVMAPGDHQRGVPPVVSPRTSSTRAAERSTKRAGYTSESASSPRVTADGHQDRTDRQRSNGNTQANGADKGDDASPITSAARSRRRAADSPREALPHRPSGGREPRSSNSASAVQERRPAPTTGPSTPGLSREGSEVINRVIISRPEVDIDREKARMAEAIPSSPTSHQPSTPIGTLSVVGAEGVEDGGRGPRSRHDHSSSTKPEKSMKFGDYFLGNTLGEGEFGKVKMGWKQEGGIQVAIKLIRRDSVGTNPTRLAKIYREIAILETISHANIVRLHEMVETEKQIGIILEYASGGELFDYILNNRYLKDNAARRLFAQLVSGVGYLHKNGIVHRDLKLENLLLDRNRNIIITDFGFANTFDPKDELGDEIEYNLSSREYVKRMELDKILSSGHRRGDLMQTSCGSPCYAAPELVVSDSLYTGRKVDVWSCGVILYAMLAGYLPFDDDPANPEGDNINLLYKYIVSTPLTFPEYVTPHARDLLRRILVPDPRKRADLFEVARHSWLSDYAHVVASITSTATPSGDIGGTAIEGKDQPDAPLLARSASVREPSKAKSPTVVGDLSHKHGNVDQEAADVHQKVSKDNKRRTVQVEYVPPRSQTQRGESTTASAPVRTRGPTGSQGPVDGQAAARRPITEKPLPQDPPTSRDAQYSQGRRPGSSQRPQGSAPARPGREPPRAVSDASYGAPPVSMARPATGGSMASNRSKSGALPHRGSYSQPAAPAVAGTNVQGRMSQPKSTRGYDISAPIMQDEPEFGQPSVTQGRNKFARVTDLEAGTDVKGHKRSSTIGSIFGRTNSIFGGKRNNEEATQEKLNKKYPPVSMSGAVGNPDNSRMSMDSRRSISFGFGKKRSGSITGSQTTLQDKPTRRFSLLPGGFSLKAIGIGKESDQQNEQRPDSYGNQRDRPNPQYAQQARNVSASTTDSYQVDQAYDRRGTSAASPPQHQRHISQPIQPTQGPRTGVPPQFLPPLDFRQDQSALTESETSLNNMVNQRGQYPPGFADYEERKQAGRAGSSGRGVLQKSNRKFTEAYEPQENTGWGAPAHNDHAGSSSAARKVMDFFRRRGRDRA